MVFVVEDKIHKETEEAGMDKFKTMKKAQSGTVLPCSQCALTCAQAT